MMDLVEIYNTMILPRRTIDANNCWIFTGPTNERGYGRITSKGHKRLLVHRVSALVNLGDSKLGALHKLECKDKRCFNPEHLYFGTQYENVQDSKKDGSFQKTRKPLTHCRRGHEMTPENSGFSQGIRYCKTCRKYKRALNGY